MQMPSRARAASARDGTHDVLFCDDAALTSPDAGVAAAGSANSSHPVRQMSNVRLLHQIAQLLGCHGRLDREVPGDVLQQLQHSRHLALCEQVNLEIELTALVGLPREAVLTGQHEQSKKDGLERDGHGQEGKREGIERTHPHGGHSPTV